MALWDKAGMVLRGLEIEVLGCVTGVFANGSRDGANFNLMKRGQGKSQRKNGGQDGSQLVSECGDSLGKLLLADGLRGSSLEFGSERL